MRGAPPALVKVAGMHEASAHEVALAWVLRSSPACVPIPGASKVTSIESSVRAASRRLDDEDLRAIG